MPDDDDLHLTDREISAAFSDPVWVERYPPVLSLEQAAELVQVPLGTLRDWRSRGLLRSCSRRVGKYVRIYRDRFVKQIFNAGIGDGN